jgi:hypothetical protein
VFVFRINQFLLLWINPFRSSLPFSPRKPRTRVTVRVPVQPREGGSMFSRQARVNITSHHQSFFVPDAKLDSRVHLQTFDKPSRDLPSEIGKGDEATQRLPGDVLICLFACEAPAHIDGHTAAVTQASCQTDLVTGRPRSPHLCSLEKSRRRGNCFIPGSFRTERG